MTYKKTILRQIKLWIWAATILPLSGLASFFFVWLIAPSDVLSLTFIIGQIAMFVIAVIWWWWAIFTLKGLLLHWDQTKDKVKEVSNDVKEIRSVIQENFLKDK